MSVLFLALPAFVFVSMISGCIVPDSYIYYYEDRKSGEQEDEFSSDRAFDFNIADDFLAGDYTELSWPESDRLDFMNIEVYREDAELFLVISEIRGAYSSKLQIMHPGVYVVMLVAHLKDGTTVSSVRRQVRVNTRTQNIPNRIDALSSPQRGGAVVSLSYNITVKASELDHAKLQVSFTEGVFHDVISLSPNGSTVEYTLPMRDESRVIFRIMITLKDGSEMIVPQSSPFAIDATAPILPVVTLITSSPSPMAYIQVSVDHCEDIARLMIAESLMSDESQRRYSSGCQPDPTAINLALPTLTNGVREVYVWAVDAAGNISADYATLSFTLDTTAPVMSLGSAVPEFVRPNAAFNLGWTITEAQAVDSQSISIELSSNNSSTWTSLHTRSSPNGALVDEAMNQDLNYPSLTGVNHRLRIRMRDAAGNQGEVVSSMFRVDNDLPVLSSVIINDGALSTISNTVQMDFVATDATSAVESVRIVEKTLASCESLYADNQWLGYAPRRNVTLSPTNGEKILCVWVKDQAGNVSTLVGDGSLGVNTAKIQMDIGLPPSFTSLHVENNNPASPHYQTQTVEVGDSIRIAWSIEDAGGLATSPVKIEVTLNGTDFTTVASSVGSLGVGITIWSSEYTAYTATTSGFIRFKITAIDAVGNTKSMMSPSLNTGRWSVFAGSAGSGDGETALAARLRRANGSHPRNALVVTADGSIFVNDMDLRAIRRIDPLTGIIDTYIKTDNASTNIPGPVAQATLRFSSDSVNRMISDGQHNLFVLAAHGLSRALFKINTLTHTIEYFAGGGDSRTDGDLATNAQMLPENALAYDYTTGNIYYYAGCPGNTGEQIFKMTRKEDGSADRIYHIAGDCSDTLITQGVDAKSTSLRRNTVIHIFRSLAYDPQHDAIYFEVAASTIQKIINDKIYYSAENSSFAYDLAYNPFDHKIYQGRSGIRTITPTASESVESRVAVSNHGTQRYLCHEDNILAEEACLAARSFAFLPGGSILFNDGYSINGISSFRVRRLDPDQRVHTVAGTLALSGHGLSRSAAQFGFIRNLRYKPTAAPNQGVFPAGLYYGDGEAMSIGRIDPIDSRMYIMGGSQIASTPATGDPFAPGKHIAGSYVAASGGIFNFDPQGLIYYSHAGILFRVDNSSHIVRVNTGTTNFVDAEDGALGSTLDFRSWGTWAGIAFDPWGRMYSGVRSAVSGISPNRMYFLDSTDAHRFYKVMGSHTIGFSADDATPGSAVSKSANCGQGTLACYNMYDSANTRLLYSEGNRIRSITTPHDSTQSTLGTLADVGRSVRAFHFFHDRQQIYYISSGLLYCFDLLASSPAIPTCNNSSIYSLTSQIGSLSGDGIAAGENNDLYVVTSSGDVILRYELP
jgi:hypothetical protein